MIAKFTRQYRPLSNFWIVKSGIALTDTNGGLGDFIVYRSIEHAYQAAKTLDFAHRFEIMKLAKPSEAKRYGNNKKLITLRPDWESVKKPLMLDLVRQKFHNNAELRTLLLSTGDQELIEGNFWHDNVWGICYCEQCELIEGKNWLGRILMHIRKEL